jgi:Protein of unknown function (DUF2842)
MSQRTRKLLGTLALLAVIILYALLVMVFVATVLPRLGPWGQLVFYAVAGLAWVPAAGWIIGWMHGGRIDPTT